jgi:mono/diheme cytochrome c family protein
MHRDRQIPRELSAKECGSAAGALLGGNLRNWVLIHRKKSNAARRPPGSSKSVEGPALFKANCAVCHGADARGGDPNGHGVRTQPSDLTRIDARNGGIYRIAQVERIISGEEQIPGGHGTRSMPAWGLIFSQIAWNQDFGRIRIHNLAVYLSRLQETLTPRHAVALWLDVGGA